MKATKDLFGAAVGKGDSYQLNVRAEYMPSTQKCLEELALFSEVQNILGTFLALRIYMLDITFLGTPVF